MCVLVGPFGPWVTMIAPVGSIVFGWQVEHVVSVMPGVWLASFGGTP